jgi:hypothetical protein
MRSVDPSLAAEYQEHRCRFVEDDLPAVLSSLFGSSWNSWPHDSVPTTTHSLAPNLHGMFPSHATGFELRDLRFKSQCESGNHVVESCSGTVTHYWH